MRSFGVVVGAPLRDDLLHLLEIVEDFAIEAFAAEHKPA